MSELMPFRLAPHLAERVWGGGRYGPGVGEAWDFSVHPSGPSTVATGPLSGETLADVARQYLDAFGGPIELLAKRLDCAENLSVQVHPTTGDAKTESWVVLEAEPGAGVYLGFGGEPSISDVRRAAEDGTLEELLHFIELEAGDAVFVPAGTVHAIGGGLVLFEVQQSSDTTYRLYDWGRGGRELHLDDGLDCAVLGPPPPLPDARPLGTGMTRLIECEFFTVDRIEITTPIDVSVGDRWVTLHGVSGRAHLAGLTVGAGDTVVVPATTAVAMMQPDPDFVGLRFGPPGPA